MIRAAALCLPCLTERTGLSAEQVNALLRSIAGTVRIAMVIGPCAGCLQNKTSFAICLGGQADSPQNGAAGPTLEPAPTKTGPTSVQPRPAPRYNEALWRYLDRHRGERFCASCLGIALGATGRIDRALLAAEGRGARRQYGACTTCRKERLLCGLPAV